VGRLSSSSASRKGLLRRPLLVFALLLIGPAVGFCILGWNSLKREHQYREREMHRTAQDVLTARLRDAVAELERLRERESRRHYYEYQGEYLPREQAGETVSFQRSALNAIPAEPYVLGWFQWELFEESNTQSTPEIFPPARSALKADLLAGYGDALRQRLGRAPETVELRAGTGRVESYRQRVVIANEERGQLQEEIELARKQGGDADPSYLRNFGTRARDDPIRVPYTNFKYMVRPRTAAGPPMIAWRMVWIPPEQTQWREVKRARWFLQGYALDPGALLPAEWESIGTAQVRRGDIGEDEDGLAEGRVFRDSLPRALGAEIAGVDTVAGFLPDVFDRSLTLVSRADYGAARAAWESARNRFLFLVAGLVFVVAVGFFVLVRSVAQEVRLVRRKEDFIAAITHELKTPLTGIRMYADMLREGWVESPEAADTYASRILDETDRLGHLVDQVLDLAALERGVAALNAQAGDMGEAVASAVALMETKAKEKGVALETAIAADLAPVTFDPKLLRPLVLNLVDNAIKYSARAEAKQVRVALDREGERMVLRVQDRGVGIPAAARKALFQPFQRGGAELTRDAPGVGIGLALVKRYAEAHRAKIVLESEPGQGTTVEVRFPI
jgi:signal transduction histidine kinase